MTRFFSILILAASIIISIASIILSLNTQKALKTTGSVTIKPPMRAVEIYKDEKGKSKYAQGTCNSDAGCTPAGCGKDVCSDDPGLITTCEAAPDSPDQNIYTCGCIDEKCVWYRK